MESCSFASRSCFLVHVRIEYVTVDDDYADVHFGTLLGGYYIYNTVMAGVGQFFDGAILGAVDPERSTST
ncbi:hypothetical protein AKJ16_DCAP17788 [Drosera capensis]